MIDGVDVSDPEGGTVWMFVNYNWIQEVQVIGLGAAAEYGGFTGVASNSLFRSGSNRFSGLIETLFQNDAMTGDNTTDAILEANPDLKSGTTKYDTDTSVQIGGPIKRDTAWFFAGFQYYRPKTQAAGYPAPPPSGYTAAQVSAQGPDSRLESSPRFLIKPTLKLSDTDQLTGFFEADSYTVDGRNAIANFAPIATLHQDSPEFGWNVNFTKVLSSTSVFDVKYSGFWGYYYLKPYAGYDVPGWYDVAEDFYAVNSYYYYNADRVRHQANASLTKYSTGFAGEHNLKFGMEFERSYVKSEWGYPGKANVPGLGTVGMYVFAEEGVPYYAQLWGGYLKDNINTRYSTFAQDSWSVNDKLTINPGVRWDHYRGFNKSLNETVFTTNGVAPRIGFAYDFRGDGKTVLRGHYGWYFDGAKSTFYDPLDPGNYPLYGAYIDENLHLISEPYLQAPGGNRTLASDIGHPRLDQAIIGFEREVFPGFSLGVTGILRDNKDFIDDVLTNGTFATRAEPDVGPDGTAGTGDETSTVLTTYRQSNDPLENEYLITNPDGAYRRYRGLEISANKRLSNRWQMQASWVYSKITGNINNTGNYGNSTEYDDPNLDPRYQPLRDGRLQRDNTNVAKVLGLYQAPWGIQVSGIFLYTTGDTFTRTMRIRLPQGRKDLFIEQRGSQRYDNQPRVDFKLEKDFRLTSNGRLGLTLEGFNILNNAAVTSRTTRSGSSYFTPQGLVPPRRFRIGVVYRF
jgi:outer membrane receptor protein involved in Fe transport